MLPIITNIKVQVTPDLSQRVQEIIFANGGNWHGGFKKAIVDFGIPSLFLYLDENLKLGTRGSIRKFKEISAYDFIASQGQQEWLPKYKELAEFSDDEDYEDYYTESFDCYNPGAIRPYITNEGAYKFCRPIQKPKTKTITIDGKNIEISLESFEDLKQQLCKG